jgi:hypothetical protein
VPVSQVKPLLARPRCGERTTGHPAREHAFTAERGKIDSLRQLIYDSGREYPRPELVTEVLRPLRSKMSANIAAMMTL